MLAWGVVERLRRAPSRPAAHRRHRGVRAVRCTFAWLVLRLLAIAVVGTGGTASAFAQPTNPQTPSAESRRADFQFGVIRYSGGQWNPRPNAWSRLAWEVRRRTSVAVDLETVAVSLEQDALFQHPFLIWQGTRAFPALSEQAIRNLRRHLRMGGTLLIDITDGAVDGGFDRSVRRALARAFPEQELARVPTEHVLYKSYYLVDRHGGRVQRRAYLEGLMLEDRLAVVISANDMGGAMARNQFGEWEYDVGSGGQATREATFRLGINLVMYALCLDYKEDQVHIPFILRRRR